MNIPPSSFTKNTDLIIDIDRVSGNVFFGTVYANSFCAAGHYRDSAYIFGRIKFGGSLADVKIIDYQEYKEVILLSGRAIREGIFLKLKIDVDEMPDYRQFLSEEIVLGLRPTVPVEEVSAILSSPCDLSGNLINKSLMIK